MSYDIDFVKKTDKRLLSIKKEEPKIGKKIGEKIKALADNPEMRGTKKMMGMGLKGYYRRLQVGQYRIIYAIEGNIIAIIKIERREGVYK